MEDDMDVKTIGGNQVGERKSGTRQVGLLH
jgi:hypothetical protein